MKPAESNQDDAVISERDNEVGYLRRADEKGGDAYQHFESFHDKDGDAYGYEKHEAYGNSNKDETVNDGNGNLEWRENFFFIFIASRGVVHILRRKKFDFMVPTPTVYAKI